MQPADAESAKKTSVGGGLKRYTFPHEVPA